LHDKFDDLHIQRFFSYLSAFAGFMLILVTGGNYFVLFVGWEGMSQCLKSINFNNYSTLESLYNYSTGEGYTLNNLIKEFFFDNKEIQYSISYAVLPTLSTVNSSLKRIGPHNKDIISIIIGSVLGDSRLEKRVGGIGTRVIFEQSNKNVEYLMWLHKYLSERGYCNFDKPKLFKRIKKKNEVIFHYRFNSYTFYSFNWIHEMFYSYNNSLILGSGYDREIREATSPTGIDILPSQRVKFYKKIPSVISDYLTPLALAIWFMVDGSKINKTVRIATNCFTYEDIEFLSTILFKKYNLKCHPMSQGKGKSYILYFSTSSMSDFSNIVKPYMIPSMYYKLG